MLDHIDIVESSQFVEYELLIEEKKNNMTEAEHIFETIDSCLAQRMSIRVLRTPHRAVG